MTTSLLLHAAYALYQQAQALQAADLKGGKGKAGDAAAGVDSTTSEVAGAVRDAGGAIADAAPVDTDRCTIGACVAVGLAERFKGPTLYSRETCVPFLLTGCR